MFPIYPYINVNDLNLDYLQRKVKGLEEIVKNFVSVEGMKIADPIAWNITTQYAKNTVVLDSEGNAYLSIAPVPAGILLTNTDYWLVIFNFMEYVKSFNSNVTIHEERNTTKATAAYSIGDWLLIDDLLYVVAQNIAIDDTFTEGVNINRATIEDVVRTYKNDIDNSELAYRNQLAQDVANTTASLQAQLNTAISGVTVDSEVINARVGADNYTHPTLGDAIRQQIINVTNELHNEILNTNSQYGYADSEEPFILSGSNQWTSDVSTHIMIPVAPGDVVTVKSQSIRAAIIAVFTEFITPSNTYYPVPLSSATGFDARIVQAADSEASYTMPADAKYLYLTKNSVGTDFTPTSVKVNGKKVVNGVIKPLADNIDLLMNLAFAGRGELTAADDVNVLNVPGTFNIAYGVTPLGDVPFIGNIDAKIFVNICWGDSLDSTQNRAIQYCYVRNTGDCAYRTQLAGTWSGWHYADANNANVIAPIATRSTTTHENAGEIVNILTYNVGRYNYGLPTPGMPDTLVPRITNNMRLFIGSCDADFMTLQEDTQYIDRSQTLEGVEYIYKPSYPFKTTFGGCSCYSKKMPHSSGTRNLNGIDDTRYMSWQTFKFNGKTLLVITLHLSYNTFANRSAELTDLFTWVNSQTFDWCIISGDFNLLTSDDKDPNNTGSIVYQASANGFAMASGNHFGWLMTSPDGESLDNILVKNGIIESVKVPINEASKLPSDHYPMIARVRLYN